jgi:hypothetical protein
MLQKLLLTQRTLKACFNTRVIGPLAFTGPNHVTFVRIFFLRRTWLNSILLNILRPLFSRGVNLWKQDNVLPPSLNRKAERVCCRGVTFCYIFYKDIK